MNLQTTATFLTRQVGDAKPKSEDQAALLWIVEKYVPKNSEHYPIAIQALGRIEGVAAALMGMKDGPS